jgi:hypothetical protein
MGKIELDHTGSGSGITLSSDGTSLLLDGTAIGGGGGGADLYAANPSSATDPVATGNNSVAIGSGAVSGSSASDDNAVAISTSATVSGSDGIAIGKNTSAGQYGTAIGRLSVASAYGSTALGANTDATANEAVAIGWTAQSTGVAAVALGNSYASGTDSFAAVIDNNTSSYGATGTSSIAIGSLVKSTGTRSTAIGREAVATTTGSLAIGYQNEASSFHSVAIGRNAKSVIRGKHAYGTDQIYGKGEMQAGLFIMLSDTTDATSEALTTNNGSASSNNQVILPNNSAYSFSGTIVARQQAADGTACAAWKVEGLIRREPNAGTTTLVGSTVTAISNTPSWGLALSADTTNGGLKIEATGAASTDIRWVATIHTSEVTYA